jgi:parvulin-like peptidyl-prolyl isomerase
VLLERGVLQITFGTERAELVVTDNGTYVVQLGNIRKVESGSLKRVEPEELESSIKETKNKAKLSLSADVLAILKKELGPFELLL